MNKAMILTAAVCFATVSAYSQNSACGGASTSLTDSQSSHPHSVTLTWTASTSSGVTGYNIYRSEGKHSHYTRLNLGVISGTSFVDRCVRPGHTYHYRARAVGQRNAESANSEEASVTVPTP